MHRIAGMLLLLSITHLLAAQKLTRWVDPFLGTGGHGHVYPGATVPFGMVQLSPDNGVEGWDWCSGYHYSSNTIAGFSHTHLSGTGIGDWCDISVLPLTDTTEISKSKILLPFDHKNEKASPGYYSVKLNNGTLCELTADTRTGHHRYTFHNKNGWLRFDMGFAINWDKSTAGMLQRIDDKTIVGYRYSTGWAKGQKVYFAARFSQPISYHQFLDDSVHTKDQAFGPHSKILLQFNEGSKLLLQVTLSSVSTEKALLELNYPTRNNDFESVRRTAEQHWEKELKKIQIDTTDKAFATRFYTALYRTGLAPVIHSDRDGAYQTWDYKNKIFAKGKNKYTIFSQWDVFRALSPLFSLTQPDRMPDLLNSLLQRYEDDGLLPVWDISTWEANTMTGYHSIPILADAILKNIKGFDYEKAYTAMRASAFQKQRGTPAYIQYGYVPQDKYGWSVTMTLEYAFDDWCIAQVAQKLGKEEDHKLFTQRAGSYAKLFDANTGFMRGRKSDGSFIEPFDPLLSEHGFDGQYIEGTAWQHSFFVPHAVDSLAALYGGKEKLVAKLDELFTAPSELHGDNVSIDVTGLIGQYAHGNEPSHHIIYMYTALGHPEKAAKWLQVVADSIYKNGPDGLSGNDDCGQMSAWYLWTSLGLYPMNPCGGEYLFGYPLIRKATMQLPNKKTLRFEVKKEKKQGPPHITRVEWNGRSIPVRSIQHSELLKGGTLTYYVAE
ncbi:MAG: glycoside hydrolase family 92 protein [Bacteroidetes bacterium]|nr:glycoside hydrolase family 92 protein [Bacteroidota bacterium]